MMVSGEALKKLQEQIATKEGAEEAKRNEWFT
mgnify:CR=1 FL=1